MQIMSHGGQIFFIPVGDFWGLGRDRVSLVYAPLAGMCFLANGHECASIQQALEREEPSANEEAGHPDSCPNASLAARLRERTRCLKRIPDNPYKITELDILLNNTCNFSCSYCYSAAGRTNRHASFATIAALLDFLFTKEKKAPLKINFSGGGEPLIDMELLKQTVGYIEELKRHAARPVSLGVVTNGSLITGEIADFVKAHQIRLVISFEVIEEFQNAERGQYGRVAAALDLLIEKGVAFGIRTNITPLTVSRMGDIVEELYRRFPRLDSITFDTVLAAALFPTAASLETYYDSFYKHFIRAKSIGNKLGIRVHCLSFLQTEFTRERRCFGKMTLTPDGAISHCARISSPKEKLYSVFIYGRVSGQGEFEADERHFERLMNHNIHTQEACRSCFARWNCGGGCYLFDCTFDASYKKAYCDFTRKCLIWELLDMLSEQHSKNHATSLANHVKAQST